MSEEVKTKIDLEDWYYFKYIQAGGDQREFWNSIRDDVVEEKDLELIKKTIETRRKYIDGNPFARGHVVADIGKVPGTTDSTFLDSVKSIYGIDDILYLEWQGDFHLFDGQRAILVDSYSMIGDEDKWIYQVAKEYKCKICTVTSVESEIVTERDCPGAPYAIMMVDPESKNFSFLFGTQDDCWQWASALCFMAICQTSDPNNLFSESAQYCWGKNMAVSLAIPGNSGCGANQLIKDGWHLIDCIGDVKKFLDSCKEAGKI